MLRVLATHTAANRARDKEIAQNTYMPQQISPPSPPPRMLTGSGVMFSTGRYVGDGQ